MKTILILLLIAMVLISGCVNSYESLKDCYLNCDRMYDYPDIEDGRLVPEKIQQCYEACNELGDIDIF